MRIVSRGVAWDTGGKARAFSVVGRVLVAAGTIAGMFDLSAVSLVIMPGMMAMFIGFVVSVQTPRELPGDVTVAEDGALLVRIGKREMMLARGDVRGAWMVRRLVNVREYYWVEIATRSGTMVSVRVASPEEGRALVDALGFGVGGRALRIPLAKRTRRLLHPVLLLAAYMAMAFMPSVGSETFPVLAFAGVYELLRFLLRAPVLEIGHDALQVRRRFGKTRVPRAAISHVSTPGSLVVERKDGTKLRVGPFGLEPARMAAAAAIIDERLGDRPAPPKADAFERKGRGLAEWRAGLQSALDPSYRTSGASVDDASAVLASSTATVEQRIGAALALRVAGEPVERVRVAAEGTLDPKIRVVLDAIADGADDEHLDATLGAMER